MTNKLSEAPSLTRLKIKEILSNIESRRKLLTMGLHIEDSLIKLNKSSWGPVLIQNISNGATKLALGRVLAEKILVEYEK